MSTLITDIGELVTNAPPTQARTGGAFAAMTADLLADKAYYGAGLTPTGAASPNHGARPPGTSPAEMRITPDRVTYQGLPRGRPARRAHQRLCESTPRSRMERSNA